jgi:DNA-binding protein H-NS
VTPVLVAAGVLDQGLRRPQLPHRATSHGGGRLRTYVSRCILGVVWRLADRFGSPSGDAHGPTQKPCQAVARRPDRAARHHYLDLSEQAADLQTRLARLTGTDVGNGVRRGRPPGRKRGSTLKGRKVAAKYRSKKDPKLTWAGRGATPRWMRDEMKARKLKKDAFLIK